MDALIRSYAFRYECPRNWEDLQDMKESDVRFCNAYESAVYLCETYAELRRHMASDHRAGVPLRLRGTKSILDTEAPLHSITMSVPRQDLQEDD